MKKIFILSLCLVYWFVTSPLVHGFCVQENQHINEVNGCHDVWETQEDCLSVITGTIQSQDITSQWNLKQLLIIPQIVPSSCGWDEISIVSCSSSYPEDTKTDWWELHIGTVKKLE